MKKVQYAIGALAAGMLVPGAHAVAAAHPADPGLNPSRASLNNLGQIKAQKTVKLDAAIPLTASKTGHSADGATLGFVIHGAQAYISYIDVLFGDGSRGPFQGHIEIQYSSPPGAKFYNFPSFTSSLNKPTITSQHHTFDENVATGKYRAIAWEHVGGTDWDAWVTTPWITVE
jgi:hypothetical protein